jgi:ABC-type uncharacterized transport system ATPase subunit
MASAFPSPFRAESLLFVQATSRAKPVRLNDGQSLMIPLDDQGSGDKIKQLVSSGQIRTLHSAEATLEEVFIQMTGRKLSE